jgi:hypothetical protein
MRVNRVAQFYPRALDSLFFASYHSPLRLSYSTPLPHGNESLTGSKFEVDFATGGQSASSYWCGGQSVSSYWCRAHDQILNFLWYDNFLLLHVGSPF